jgi:mRNA interferase RelE/StbE
MGRYKITVSKSAVKELSKLPGEITTRVLKVILKLSDNPRPAGSKKLKGGSDNWRIRIGDYRVVYAIDDKILIVDIRKVGHRKEIYE